MKLSRRGIIWVGALAGAAAGAPAQAQETPEAELVYPPPYEC